MAADLSGVWAKIARADEHFDLLEREIRAFTDRDPQPIGLSIPKFDAESGWFIAYAMEAEPPPPRLGVILGDLVHDTRSALDHLVWQLVILNGATPKRSNTFPLTLTEASWENAIRNGCLQGVSKKHQAIIKRVQPNQGPNGPEDTYTGVLGHLSNIDKHQIVHVTAFIMRDPTQSILIRVTRGPGEVVQWQFHGHANIEHGAESSSRARRTDDPGNRGGGGWRLSPQCSFRRPSMPDRLREESPADCSGNRAGVRARLPLIAGAAPSRAFSGPASDGDARVSPRKSAGAGEFRQSLLDGVADKGQEFSGRCSCAGATGTYSAGYSASRAWSLPAGPTGAGSTHERITLPSTREPLQIGSCGA